jgi:hypothetical protein
LRPILPKVVCGPDRVLAHLDVNGAQLGASLVLRSLLVLTILRQESSPREIARVTSKSKGKLAKS